MGAAARRRVLIVGAGVGGLTAARALRRRGHDVVVFDRMAEPSRFGAAFTLSPNATLVLQALGVEDAVEARGATLERFSHKTPRGSVLANWPIGDVGRTLGAPTVAISRVEVQELLLDALDSADVRFGHEFSGLDEDDSGVTARFANGVEEHGDALVGADGAQSTIRSLFDDTERRYAGYTTWGGIAPFEHDDLAGAQIQTYGRGTVLGTKPIGGGRTSWYLTHTTPAGGRSEDAKGEALALFKGWHEPVESLIEATDPSMIARSDLYDLPRRESWGAGRVTLLGDAAHPMVPALGQGACQAIEDADALAHALDGVDDPAAALRAFEARRIPRTATIVERARRLGQMFQGDTAVVALKRDVSFRLTPTRKVVQGMEAMLGEGARTTSAS